MKPFNPKKDIQNVDDYIGYACEMFDEYLQTFTKEAKLIREVEEGDSWEEGIDFLYTTKGDRLATKMRNLLVEIGEAHFPGEDIEIESNYYVEY